MSKKNEIVEEKVFATSFVPGEGRGWNPKKRGLKRALNDVRFYRLQ